MIFIVAFSEELHESTKCVDTKSERKYSCRAGGKQLCLKYDDLCDFHAECEHDEDESEDLHRCCEFNSILRNKRTIPAFMKLLF